MTVSKRELKLYLKSLHPLDVGLIFRVYKGLNYSDIHLDKLSGKRIKCVTRSSDLNTRNSKKQKNNKIRVKYFEYIKYLAENLFEINIKDLGHLQSSELREILQYIKENEPSISKIYSSHKFENFLFSILKIHIIFILQTSILLSETSEIKALINGLWNLLLYSEVDIEDIFHSINNDELIQIYNLVSCFLELKQEAILDDNLNAMLIDIFRITKAKIKNHLNILLLYSLEETQTIDQSNLCNWIRLIDSDDIVISNEDSLLHFLLKKFKDSSGRVKHIIDIIRSDFLSESAKDIYNQIQNLNPNHSEKPSRNKYLVNDTITASTSLKNPRITFLNKVSEDSRLPIINKHLVINDNLEADSFFSYEIQISSKGKSKFPGNYNNLVEAWQLFFGFTVNTGQELHPFAFDLFSVISEDSNKHETDRLFRSRSIVKSSKPNFITDSVPINDLRKVPAPTLRCKEEKPIKEEIALRNNNGDEIIGDKNKVVFAINWRERFLLVEVGGLFSVYIDIKDISPLENFPQPHNAIVFPLISYNDECFNAEVSYYSCKLEVCKRAPRPTGPNLDHNRRWTGSKTRRKAFMDVNKKQSGAPKRATRLRPLGSTNVVIPFLDSLNSPPPQSVISPTNKRGRPRKNALSVCISEMVPMNSKQEFSESPLSNASKSKKNYVSEHTKAKEQNTNVIKTINKNIKITTKHSRNQCSSSFIGRIFADSINKLFGFFSNRPL